jgi:hypothetical protein
VPDIQKLLTVLNGASVAHVGSTDVLSNFNTQENCSNYISNDAINRVLRTIF